MKRSTRTPNDQGLCDCCFYPFDGNKVWHNGGFCHARCAAEHELLILGDDAMPCLVDHLDYLDDLHTFITRLGKEAAHMGIDRQKLANAIERASHA
jgi:hypothetical protein